MTIVLGRASFPTLSHRLFNWPLVPLSMSLHMLSIRGRSSRASPLISSVSSGAIPTTLSQLKTLRTGPFTARVLPPEDASSGLCSLLPPPLGGVSRYDLGRRIRFGDIVMLALGNATFWLILRKAWRSALWVVGSSGHSAIHLSCNLPPNPRLFGLLLLAVESRTRFRCRVHLRRMLPDAERPPPFCSATTLAEVVVSELGMGVATPLGLAVFLPHGPSNC